MNDTIAAISTSLGESGIGIVRISGKDSLLIADKIFLSKDGKKPSEYQTYTLHYGWIVDKKKNPPEFVDEVLLAVMRAPKSYTREDIVEINCHGGIVPLRKVLDLVLENGARLATPGEFTKRAFLNGRIDLTQAEAVLDIIQAKTDSSLRLANAQLQGKVSQYIKKYRKDILEILVELEANIDFPEEEIPVAGIERIKLNLESLAKKIKTNLDDFWKTKILKDGLRVVICGRTNVGKSSLLNALLKTERAIVSSIAGTTRDIIEEVIQIGEVPLRIADTAGIIEPRDIVTKKAIERTHKFIDLADLVLLVFDGSQKLQKEDISLIRKLKAKKKPVLAIINKIDLPQKIEKERLKEEFGLIIEISAKRLKNFKLLEEKITDYIYRGKVISSEGLLISNFRHYELLKKVYNFLKGAVKSLEEELSIEFVAEDLKQALELLDELLGRNFSDDLLDKIFKNFCIGK